MTVHVIDDISVDGLHTVVVMPASSPRAVLLLRTAYDTRSHLQEAQSWARQGITVVLQDVRGRHRSTGSFHPYENEGADGLVTARWVADQPWSTAPLFLYGASYSAHCAVETAIAAATAGLDVIGGVSVAVPALGLGETARNVDGCFQLHSRVGWWLEHGADRTSRGDAVADSLLWTLPVSDIGQRAEPPIPQWQAVVSAARRDRSRSEQVGAVHYPLFSIGGTSDWFAQDTIDLWTSWGGPAHLVIGPWDHSLHGSGRAALMTAWIDDVLDGTPPEHAIVHVPGTRPVELHRWPRNSRVIRLPGGEFHSDPARPFPSRPLGDDLGQLVFRSDCLAYEFAHPAETITGTPIVRIGSASPPGHWAAALAVRRVDGRLEQVAHGMSNNETITLTPLSVHLRTQETLSVLISAHSFPRHPRDLQNGQCPLTGTTMSAATRIVTDVHVELPA